MNQWKIVYTSDALKDKKKAMAAGFEKKILRLLEILKDNPFNTYPPYEKLIGDYTGAYSRRINFHYRLVYSVHKEDKKVKIISMWAHYE